MKSTGSAQNQVFERKNQVRLILAFAMLKETAETAATALGPDEGATSQQPPGNDAATERLSFNLRNIRTPLSVSFLPMFWVRLLPHLSWCRSFRRKAMRVMKSAALSRKTDSNTKQRQPRTTASGSARRRETPNRVSVAWFGPGLPIHTAITVSAATRLELSADISLWTTTCKHMSLTQHRPDNI